MIALVPTKATQEAKSRLALPAPLHDDLVTAMREDVLAALRDSPRIDRVVVVDEPGGLNAALRAAAARLAVTDPTSPVVVVPADLAALTTTTLDAALADATTALAPTGLAFVRDAEGTGTSLLVAATPDRLDPRYGPGSAAAHARTATEIDADPRVRRDVDTLADLYTATALGLGPACAGALSAAATTGAR